MNAYMLIATAWLAGNDPAVATPLAAAPVHSAPVVSTGGCCGGAPVAYAPYHGDCCDPCCRPSLLDRLRARFARPVSCGCDPCATAPVVIAAPCCEDPCRPRLFSRIRGLFSRNYDCCDPCATVGGACGCETHHAVPVQAAPGGVISSQPGQAAPPANPPAKGGAEPLPPGSGGTGIVPNSTGAVLTPNRITLESQPF